MASNRTETHAHVLQLCIDYVDDVQVLVRLGSVSKAVQATCSVHVQQHLPALLVAAHNSTCEVFKGCKRRVCFVEPCHLAPLEWLYRSAGPATVGSPATAEALLRIGPQMPWRLRRMLMQLAVQHGMQLTTDIVVAAAKARANIDDWLEAFFPRCRDDASSQLPTSATLAPQVLAVALGNTHALTPLLPIITQEQMPDLLHIAVNAWHRDTSIIEALLQHDKQCTCILHNDSSSYNSTCSADNRSSATVLLEQLLLTSFGCYQRNVVQLLGATPAARSLSKGTLLRLLYITLQRDVEERSMGCQPEDLDGNSPSTFGAMCRSPAIQSVSAASIGRLMQVAMGRQQYASVGLLTTLPQAQQLPSQQLCDLLVMLIRAVRGDSQLLADDLGRQALLQRLATLQTGQYLASGDAYRLLTAVLDGRHPVLCMMFQYLAPMHLEHQLTGSELLQLLWQVVRRGSHAWTDLVSLKPAADQINDEAGYVAFLGYAIGAIGVKQVELDPDRIGLDDLANKISLTQRLGVESVVSLLSRCVAVERFHQFVLQIPAIQQLSAEQLEHLLLQVAHAGFLHKLQQLLNLPAAAQMKPMVLQQLVQAVLVRQADTVVRDLRPDLKVIHQLLALPAAGAMTSDAVAEMLQQTCQMLYESSASSSSWNYYGGAGGSKHAVLISIKARLMQLTAALRPTPDSIVPFLQAAIAAEDTEQLSIFSEYPAAKHISSSAAEQLLEAALELGNLKVIRILQEGVPAVAAVTAVVQPTGVQLQRQMAYAIGHQVKHALASLCRHPAASQISTGEMQRLLRDMLRLVGMGCWHVTDADQDPVQLLFCTAAAQALDSAAVVELLESCLKGYGIQQRSEAICISLIALLPASAQVEVHCIENLLSQVLQALPKGGSSHSSSSTTNAWEAFEGFLQLPATQALPSAAVMHQLQTAVEQQVQLQYVQLMASVLPGFQNLSADDFKALMLAAIATKDASTYSWLRHLSAAPSDDEVQAWSVFMGMTESGTSDE